MTIFVIAMASLAAMGRPVARQPTELDEVDRLIVEQTNGFRHSQGLAPTTLGRQLTAAAHDFAAYMARTDRYGHEADGREPWQRAQAHGYAYCLVSENIAYEFSSKGFATGELAKQLVDGWKQSPPHRRNLLQAQAVETGVAVARSPRSGRYYAVQMFGRPAAMRVTFRVANRSSSTLHYEVGGKSFELAPRVTRTHQQCQAETVQLHLPGQAQAIAIEPANGTHYAIRQNSQGLQVVRD